LNCLLFTHKRKSRAAELAGGAGNSLGFENLGGFAQFAGTTPTAVHSRPSTPSSMDSDSTDLDPELVVIVKKISKRDAVTKLKALEELEGYLQSNKHAIGLILRNWVNDSETGQCTKSNISTE
jgi:hypothetical protein